MTDHPCKGLSPRAVEAFERICIGDRLPQMTGATVNKLLAKGLIEKGPEKQLGDRLGKFSIPQYQVPMPLFIQWCEWCSEQPDFEDEKIGASA